MIKSIRALGKATYDDFDIYINSRNIPIPAIKEITDTIPYMNGSYDFSYIDGEAAREDNIISYGFDISEFSIEEMEFAKRSIISWLSRISDTDIFDDYIKDYHFHGSAITPDWSEDASQGELVIKFRVYPYMIKNDPKIYAFTFSEDEIKNIQIENNSDHSIVPKITCENNSNIEINEFKYSLSSGIFEDSEIMLKPGTIDLKIQTTGNFKIEFFEEVL